MIPRYSRPKMSAIWSQEAQFRTWLDIEVLACEGWAKVGKVPADALKQIKKRPISRRTESSKRKRRPSTTSRRSSPKSSPTSAMPAATFTLDSPAAMCWTRPYPIV